ncbi:hypothetical protein PRIPAC_90196 [Pristionchus pacificus]|uniref:BTB And C-terminal Kelch domain containing protein n=1 Tax=Pristionchus pacificus TaxID=54126 RepID=A0A2A6CZ78_PRIPA|nr:hypothetical protein PRIPAC_90196 [Pristionchus pacificus]|eukprot:PDM83475.1 BTB And C-terminal Kelch domain containing protein [Pristionchus pacificus]
MYLYFFALDFIDISLTPEFAGLSFDGLVSLLKRDSLRVDNEKQVFDVVDRWINEDSSRLQYSAQLLRSIRWSCLPSSFIDDIVERKEWVVNCPKAVNIINETKN